jgi:hypothetical protein
MTESKKGHRYSKVVEQTPQARQTVMDHGMILLHPRQALQGLARPKGGAGPHDSGRKSSGMVPRQPGFPSLSLPAPLYRRLALIKSTFFTCDWNVKENE